MPAFAGCGKSNSSTSAAMSAVVRTVTMSTPSAVTVSVSPATAPAGIVTETTNGLLASVADRKPLSFRSLTIDTTGIFPAIRSIITESELAPALLPVASDKLALIVSVSPSAGRSNVFDTTPVTTSDALSTVVCTTDPSVVSRISPTAALAGSEICTVIGSTSSARDKKPSLLLSLVIVKVTIPGAEISTTISSVCTAELLPAGSLRVAVTVSVPPSLGRAKVFVIEPAVSSAALSTTL